MSYEVNERSLQAFGDAYVIVAGMGPRGRQHATIWRDGQLVHDPHPSGTGLVSVEYVDLLYPLDAARFLLTPNATLGTKAERSCGQCSEAANVIELLGQAQARISDLAKRHPLPTRVALTYRYGFDVGYALGVEHARRSVMGEEKSAHAGS